MGERNGRHVGRARVLRPSRRALLTGAASAGLGLSGTGALAQSGTQWWETIFQKPGQGPAPRPKAREEEAPDDLRQGPTPWRSDVMLQSIDKAIETYERIASRGGWPSIPKGRTMRPGESDERVPLLRRRLQVAGDLPARGASFGDSYEFDGYLEIGVKAFQDRHGLRPTMRADLSTLAQLNVSATARLEQLKLNRRRIAGLLQNRVEDRYVLVNAAAFQLEAVENWEVRQRHRVIVGRPDRQTPEIHATIRAANFFPYWRVPKSVATLDLIPRLQKEPDYLSKEMIRVYNGVNGPELDPASINWAIADGNKLWFRQEPGPQNALGLVRIDMPNPEIVYMHDTPLKPLFKQRGRAFSAGCVRVENVMKLVEWLLQYEQGWGPGQTDAVIDAGQALDVTMTRPVPVYFTYITAWAEQDGQVFFRPDVYGRDGSRDLAGERDPDAPPPPHSGLAP